MPKININGVTREMVDAEYERMWAELPMPEHNAEDEWKLQIEAALIELAAMVGGA